MRNDSLAANHHIKMISKGSCDSFSIKGINSNLKYIIEKVTFN